MDILVPLIIAPIILYVTPGPLRTFKTVAVTVPVVLDIVLVGVLEDTLLSNDVIYSSMVISNFFLQTTLPREKIVSQA